MRGEQPGAQAVGDGRRPVARHAADHAHRRDRDARARTQSAAADRCHHHVEIADLLHELERGGARAGDDALVVERMDLDAPVRSITSANAARRASSVLSHSVTCAP